MSRSEEVIVGSEVGSAYADEQLLRAQREAAETSIEHTILLHEAGIVDHLISHNDRYRAVNEMMPVIDVESAVFGIIAEGKNIDVRGWWNNPPNGEVSNVRQDWRWRVHSSPEYPDLAFVGYDDEPEFALTPLQWEVIRNNAQGASVEKGAEIKRLKRLKNKLELRRFPARPGAVTEVGLAPKPRMKPDELMEHYFPGTPEQRLSNIADTNAWLMNVLTRSKVYDDQLDRVMVLLVKARAHLAGSSPELETSINETLGAYLKHHQFLVTQIASRRLHGAHRLELEDLVVQGQVGMLESLRKVDLSLENEVLSFLNRRISGSMVDEIRENGALIRIPRSVFMKQKRLESNDPTLVGEEREEAEEEVRNMKLMNPAYLEEAVPSRGRSSMDDNISFMDMLPDESAEAKEIDAEALPHIDVEALVSRLPRRYENVIRMYLGLQPYTQSYNLREIGDQLGVTESRVSQLLTKALSTLQYLYEKSQQT